MLEAKVGEGERQYFNGEIRKIETDSSVLVSSSKYLNHPELRALIAQEMLRRNGADMPNTAYIPEVAQILHMLEDFGENHRLFEAEKERLPLFKEWLDKKSLADFTKEEVKNCAPGTLGEALYKFMTESGYELDVFFREIQVTNDFTYYLRQTALTHDIEHMVTGFGPNHGGEVALLTANMHARNLYFCPELAAFFGRIAFYLKAKTIMKDGLHYPKAMAVNLEAEYHGAVQGRNWKYPIMLVDWRAHVDTQISDLREELNITPVPDDNLWADTNELSEDPREEFAEAAE
ncbi:MAG: Coq4 family protein [Pseudomonadota bacterium]